VGRSWLLIALGLLATGCEQRVTFSEDIKPLVDQRCGSCHQAGGLAPFSLSSYGEVFALRASILAAVESRRMPPYLASPDCNPLADDIALTDEQIKMVRAWVEQGAKEGAPTEMADPTTLTRSGLPSIDFEVKMAEAYVPTQAPDDYRCFVMDWPKVEPTYVTGFAARPGNAAIVHHVIAYLIPPERADEYVARDAEEAGTGYTCFGGPGGALRGISWLGAWAPGGEGRAFPTDTGILVSPGSKIVLQVHYNLQQPGAQSDQTTVELSLSEQVRHRAALMPFTNIDWVRGEGMQIPANQSGVVHRFAFDMAPYLGLITAGALEGDVPFRIYSASLHQHLLGTRSRLELIRQDGANECLLDIPRWDFHWQRAYPFVESKLVKPGDQLAIECEWDNSAGRQPQINGQRGEPRDVQWGESTHDEMCLGLFYVSQ
jgi:hypothetical protein